ncbi:UdgX family uracil-DNA binding protein [Caenimonas terrae]|uniref:Type-4 uracil-DNA glycosylase n=1 Tax=Caenimonas terrae TaxID=696074 RepID=A0ABW0NHY2_9BURK
MHVRLAGETDLAGFRERARALLAAQVAPDAVQWSTQARSDDLFADAAAPAEAAAAAPAPKVAVPASFLALCESVVLHRDPQRFALLYRLLWRLAHEPQLRHDPLDADMLRARDMAHAVGHDIHKMRAFVRFREVGDGDAAGPLHVAWFEPEHHIVQANAPWFMRRFAQMRWAILTPDRCAQWRPGGALQFSPGVGREQAPPADAGEQLWLTYYRNIFNPARLKLAMMRKEMPRKYWHNLPEAALIAPLAAQARERSGRMIAQPASETARRFTRLPPAVPDAPPTASVQSLQELRQTTQHCRRCPIGACATQAVNGEGPVGAALMVVGEQPGDQEDLQGRPFVGPAGQLFDRALARLALPRESLFVSNAVRHFKFELRGRRRIHKTPGQQEAAACAQWLEQEIALVQPRALVALGATAARSLLGRPVAVTQERGRWLQREDGLPVLVTLHPSALLRMQPGEQPAAFEAFVGDLGVAMDAIGPKTVDRQQELPSS